MTKDKKTTTATGFITQEKWIHGKSLIQMEDILGFQMGRFSKGVVIKALLRIPVMNEFECRAYTIVAGHNYEEKYGNFNVDKNKKRK